MVSVVSRAILATSGQQGRVVLILLHIELRIELRIQSTPIHTEKITYPMTKSINIDRIMTSTKKYRQFNGQFDESSRSTNNNMPIQRYSDHLELCTTVGEEGARRERQRGG
eukprot:78079_1